MVNIDATVESEFKYITISVRFAKKSFAIVNRILLNWDLNRSR